MINEKQVPVYWSECEKCGYVSGRRFRKNHAEADEKWHSHVCGQHREAHDSTGGYRGILGGFNRRCVCGARYVSESDYEPFKCPKDVNV